MKRFGLFVLLFSITSAAFGQVSSGVSIAPVAFGFSNSVVDLNGNVLIFDESFPLAVPGGAAAPTFLPPQTHVIVVAPDGTVTGNYYPGSFQILGVGQNGVYASVNTFTFATTSTGTIATPVFTRQIVVLHVGIGDLLPTTLPAITVGSNQDAKLSLAVGQGMPDTIALVSGNTFILPPILAGVTTSPVASTPHMVWLYTCDGLKFTPNQKNPISTAGK